MKQIKIAVEVVRTIALAANRNTYGESLYAPTPEFLASLTDAERAVLAALPEPDEKGDLYPRRDERLTLDTPEVTAEGVKAALAALVAEAAAERAKAAAAAEAKAARIAAAIPLVEAWYARPDEELIEYQGTSNARIRTLSPAAVGLEYSDFAYTWEISPLATARRQAILDSIEAAKEARKAAEAAEVEAKKAHLVSVEHDACSWLAEHATAEYGRPELARAAREGRKVLPALREAAVARFSIVLAKFATDRGWHVPEDLYGSQPREDVPSREAYALLDALTAAKPQLAEATGLPNAEVTIGPIARHDVSSKKTLWRTGIRIEISHPWLTDEIVDGVLVEPVEDDDDE